jgi:signal transduction histidine kinase
MGSEIEQGFFVATDQTPSTEYVRQLEILRSVDLELARRLDMNYVLHMALDAAVRLGLADAGAIHLVEGRNLRRAHCLGNFPESAQQSYVPADAGLIGRALRLKRAEMILDVQSDPDYVAVIPQTRAQISIPLIANDMPIGVLNIQTSNPEQFTASIFKFMQLLSARVALAIYNAQLYQQVRELENLKTDMIRIAAHDLRNPLTNIVSAFELLKYDLPPEVLADRGEMFEVIQRAIARMRNIIIDILSLERIENLGRDKYQTVDLGEFCTRVHAEHQPEALDKGQQLTLMTPDTPVLIAGDLAQLYEVAANLVGNAIKYTPVGGSIDIELKSGARTASVEVRDTGYGVPENQQAKLFSPFYRAISPETQDIEGNGLGLHLVKRVIERHNGHVIFNSVYGHGSTFGFELPLAAGSG